MTARRQLLNKRMVWLIPVAIALLINPLIYTTSKQEYISHFIFETIFFLCGVVLAIFLRDRFFNFTWQKSSERELKAEDSVLLEGVGLFQGTLFIYLNLAKSMAPPTIYRLLLQWSIPIVTTLFYVVRSYGAIKDSSKHRYNSAMILIYYMIFQTVLLITTLISKYIPIYVGSKNIVPFYLPSSSGLIFLYFYTSVRNALKIRYNYK